MFRSKKEKLISRFRAIAESKDHAAKDAIIQRMADELPPGDARDALVELLRSYGIHTPPLRGQARYVDGFRPDSWRGWAYKALIDRLCSPDEAFGLLRETALEDADEERQVEALRNAARRFSGRDDCLALLIHCTEHCKQTRDTKLIAEMCPDRVQAYIRSFSLGFEAYALLVEHFPRRREVIGHLREAITASDDENLRMKAINALAEHHADDPKTLPLLERVAIDGVGAIGSRVRNAALAAFANLAPKDDRLFCMLNEQARASRPQPSIAAMQALAEHFAARPETLPFLIEQARCHEDLNTRDSIMRSLVNNVPEKPEVMALLIAISAEGGTWNERSGALWHLFQEYSERPEVRDHIRSRVALETDDRVRRTLVEGIQRRFPEEQATMEVLIERLRVEHSDRVRETIERILARPYGRGPSLWRRIWPFG